MKIAINATPVPPVECGAGVYIIELIQALSRVDSHHEYLIFAKNDGKDHFDHLGSNFQVIRFDLHRRSQRLLWEQLNLPTEVRRHQPDLFHSPHYTLPLINLPCPRVVTFHDLTFFLFPECHEWLRRLFFQQIMRRSARTVEQIITVSENTRTDLIRLLNVPAEKVTAVNSGVSSFFYPVDDRPRTSAPYICFVGTLEPRKNVITLMQAFDRLRQEADIPHRLKIVGHKGWMYDSIFAEVQRLRLETQVDFEGYVTREELRSLYQQADLFVYPSLYEGFGFPPLEAMACRTPTITTTAPAMCDLFERGALLVPPNDTAALAHAMQKVLVNPQFSQELAQKGYQLAQKFSWDNTARQTIAVYEQFA